MDPMTLAASVVTVIRPLLGAHVDADISISPLYCTVRDRLIRDTYHDTVLRGAEEQPDNDCRLQSLAAALAEVASGDNVFAAEVAGLLAEAAPARYLQAVNSSASPHRTYL